MHTAPTVFISYSHKDKAWKDRLLDHLGGLEEEGLLTVWNDQNIGAGDEWFEEIRKAMDAAKVAIFLVSAHSLKSKFIRHQEIPHLLAQRVQRGMTFFPVIVKSSLWKELSWLSRFQALPIDGRPLASFRGDRADDELAKIAKEILETLRNDPNRPQTFKPINSPRQINLLSLHQLPTPPDDFTGREKELDSLRFNLAQSRRIFGFWGMGGVGKTTLALKLADEFKPSYPDAQIYLDLKGVDSQPLTPARAMAHTICSLHPEARIPEIDSELVALYRSVLDGKRVLLLMDNAAKREQVEPLMPPSTSLLLVTSRFHFYLPGLIPKDLNELPEQDAIDLLLKIAHRIGSAAAEIARLTGRLPLALRLAGSALAERLDLSPSDYIRRLIEKKETLGPVEASLKTSYDLLGEEQRRLWRLLSVFPESFDSQAAAAVWNLEMDEAREHIGEFVRSSLVEWEDSEGRYRLHDLARDFARRQMMANERCEGDRRHAEYFLKILHSANLLYSSGGQESFLGLSLFDREWGNIRAGQAWAASRFQECKEEAVTCSSYPAAGSFCLPIRQHLKDRICWLEAAVEAARYQRDRRSEAAHLGNLVLAYLAIGNYRQTIELSTQLLKIAREVQDRQFEGGALGNLGLAYNALGDVQQAARFFEQHLHITREMSDSRGESNALVNLGLTHAALGDFRTAISFYEKVIAISRKIGSLEQEGGAIGNLGIAYAALGDHQRAINYFERHRDIAKQLGDRRGEGTALGNLGTSYIALDDFDHALEHFRQHLAIGIEIGDRAGESYALGNLANIYAVLGDRESALKLCKQRLAMAREMGDRLGEGIAGWNLGIVFEEEGELDSAVDSMEIYVDYLGGIGHSDAEKYAARLKALRARIAEQKSLTPTPVPPPAPPSASAPSSPDPALPSTRPSKA